jgi:hypothetical protein
MGAADPRRRAGGRSFIEIENSDTRAMRREQPRGCEANAARTCGARDHGNPVG